MKVWKKLSAVALALVMVMALSVPAFAEGETTPTASTPETLDDGKIGTYTDADIQNVDNKQVNIKKEITAYNPTESYVYGPAISYTYAIAAASGGELTTVTDNASNHDPAQAITKTALSGVTTDVTMTGTAADTIAWTNADVLEASATGTANYKNLTIDFGSVVFTEPGIYRYKITETATYTGTGVTETSVATNSHVRYLDVYVMRSDSYTTDNATTAAAWKIYGYVCISDTAAITPSAISTKTNGFVDSANDGSNADQYHTYNLTVSKTLNGDTTMNSHKFPFAVAFTNSATSTFQLAAKVTNNAEVTKTTKTATATVNGTDINSVELDTVGTAAAMSSYTISGLNIPNAGTVKFIGIPDGTTVAVTERNDVAGTTYTTTATQKTGTAATIESATATAVSFDNTSETGSTGTLFNTNQAVSIYNNQTAKYVQSTAPARGEDVVIAFLNKLALISPTGVTLRYAPYMAMMGLGVVALPLSLRKKEELD